MEARVASSSPLGSAIHLIAKLGGLGLGLIVSLLLLMSLAAKWLPPLPFRFGVAALSIGIVSWILVGLVPERWTSFGAMTDLLAVVWLAGSVGSLALAGPTVVPLLLRESERLSADRLTELARFASWLASPEERKTAEAILAQEREARTDAGPSDAGPLFEQSARGPARVAPEGPTRTPAEVFREWAPSVVAIVARGHDQSSGGTGFVVDARGIVVTSNHLVEDAAEASVKVFGGAMVTEVEVLKTDRELDLALLRIKSPVPLKAVMLGDSDRVAAGDRIVAIGNPLGLEHTLAEGRVSSLPKFGERKLIEVTLPITRGRSGEPVFDLHGQVIGVTSRAMLEGRSLALAIPTSVLFTMLGSSPGAGRQLKPLSTVGR